MQRALRRSGCSAAGAAMRASSAQRWASRCRGIVALAACPMHGCASWSGRGKQPWLSVRDPAAMRKKMRMLICFGGRMPHVKMSCEATLAFVTRGRTHC